jgi:hypothetical protein
LKRAIVTVITLGAATLLAKPAGASIPENGTYWEQLPGCASSIAMGANGDLWVLDCHLVRAGGNGGAYRYDDQQRAWVPKAGWGVRIAISQPSARGVGGGTPWIVQADGSIWRGTSSSGDDYVKLPSGCASEIAVGPDEAPWIIECGTAWDRRVLHWNGARFEPVAAGGFANKIAMGFDNQGSRTAIVPWATQAEGDIYYLSAQDKEWHPSGGAGSSITTDFVVAGSGAQTGNVWLWLAGPSPSWQDVSVGTPNAPIRQIASSTFLGTFDSVMAPLAAIDIEGNIYRLNYVPGPPR